jgi:hypothetical protein
MPARGRSRRHRQTFTKHDVARVLGLRFHHLMNFVNRGFLTPSVSRGRRGRGGERLFNVCDLVAIRSAQELTRLGLVGRRLRPICRKIRQIERTGTRRALLVITHAGEALHVPTGRDVVRLLRQAERPFGHLVLDLDRISRAVRRATRKRSRGRTAGPLDRRVGR